MRRIVGELDLGAAVARFDAAMADEVASAGFASAARAGQWANVAALGIGPEQWHQRLRRGADLDVLIGGAPFADERERLIGAVEIVIAELVGAMSRAQYAGARTVGDDEAGGAGSALATRGEQPGNARAAVERGVDRL